MKKKITVITLILALAATSVAPLSGGGKLPPATVAQNSLTNIVN